MADFTDVDTGAGSYGAHGHAEAYGPGGMTLLLGWLGAAMSIALLAGLSWWGYQLAVRDVSGVPVVRALEGPMRIAPEDPGGAQAAHQGFSVNSVAAEGAAARPADRLLLAPPPIALTEEDMPRPDLTPGNGGVQTTVLDEAAPVPDGSGLDAPGQEVTRQALINLADTIAADVTPLDVEGEAPLALIDQTPVSAPIPSDIRGVTISLRPMPRPLADVTALAVASEVALTVSRPAGDIPLTEVPAGTRLVQFGAFDTPELAAAAWDRLDGKFGDFLIGKQRVVQEAVSGGKTFYRLRAKGFADLNDARRFCAAIVAERQACIPVVVR